MSKVLLGDVAKERRETCKGSKDGYPIVGLEHLTPEEITLIAWDEDKENTFSKMFRESDILFGRRRAYLKKAVVAPFDGICSGDITVIEAMPERILPELLPFIIQNDALFDFAVGKSAGSLSPRVKWENLKNYEFELPEMDKQRELAKVLWAIDTTKKTYQKMLQKTDELVKSHFIEMFGDPMTNPKGWKKERLKNHADILSGYPFDSSGYVDNGVKICGGLIIMPDRIAWEDCKYWPNTDGFENYLLEDGDIVIAMDRPWISGGFKIAQIRQTELPALLIQRTSRIRSNVLDQKFILFLLKDVAFVKHCNITQTTVPHISVGDIRDYEVLLPPKELQQQFTAFVEQADKSKFELEQALKELNSTYKRIISENLG